MAKRKSVASAAAKTSKPTVAAIEAEELDKAAAALNIAVPALRVMASCFDGDGEPNPEVEAVDMAVSLQLAIRQIKVAADALFSFGVGTWVERRAVPMLERLWDTADVLIITRTVLDAGKFPDGDGMTACPVQGALNLALERLESIRADVADLAARAHAMLDTPAKRRAARPIVDSAREAQP